MSSGVITDQLSLIHSYRHLYRALLHAVQFSKPNRYTARDQLREAYRRGDPADFNAEKVAKTLEFLQGAARETGMEHKMVKTILHTTFERIAEAKRTPSSKKKSLAEKYLTSTAHVHYDMTVAMLNHSMGLCLPAFRLPREKTRPQRWVRKR